MKFYLYLLALTTLSGLSVTFCSASDASVSECRQWSITARQTIEATPWLQRYHKALEQIGKACPTVPLNLREAARKSLKEKETFKSKLILLEAAAPYFDPACIPYDPTAPASVSRHFCNIKDIKGDYPEYLDSATYFYGLALLQEFETSRDFDEAVIVVYNFFKSNGFHLEMEEERRGSKTKTGSAGPNPAATDSSQAQCWEWSTRACKAVESAPVGQRYNTALEQFTNTCRFIPLSLREAAGRSLKAKNSSTAKRILLDAAAPYFNQGCIPNDPTVTANFTRRSCDIKDEGRELPGHIDAATFFYGLALGQELKKTMYYDRSARKLVRLFFKSSMPHLEMEENNRLTKKNK